MSLQDAVSDPVFWLLSAPLALLFIASIVRIARPYRKSDQ